MLKIIALFFISKAHALEVHCTTNAGHNIELVFKKTPYHIVSINQKIKRTVHIEDINNLDESKDYFIEQTPENTTSYRLKCQRILK